MQESEQRESDLPKLSAPARRALAGVGCWRLDQVANHSEAVLKRLHGLGPNGLEQLRRALAAKGLAFAAEEHVGQ